MEKGAGQKAKSRTSWRFHRTEKNFAYFDHRGRSCTKILVRRLVFFNYRRREKFHKLYYIWPRPDKHLPLPLLPSSLSPVFFWSSHHVIIRSSHVLCVKPLAFILLISIPSLRHATEIRNELKRASIPSVFRGPRTRSTRGQETWRDPGHAINEENKRDSYRCKYFCYVARRSREFGDSLSREDKKNFSEEETRSLMALCSDEYRVLARHSARSRLIYFL